METGHEQKIDKWKEKRLIKYWKSDSSWLVTVTGESKKGIGSPGSQVADGSELGIKSRSTVRATNDLSHWFTSPAPGNYLNSKTSSVYQHGTKGKK